MLNKLRKRQLFEQFCTYVINADSPIFVHYFKNRFSKRLLIAVLFSPNSEVALSLPTLWQDNRVFSKKIVNSISENQVIFTLAFFQPRSIKLFCDLNFFLKV